jgi:hypothetical protein
MRGTLTWTASRWGNTPHRTLPAGQHAAAIARRRPFPQATAGRQHRPPRACTRLRCPSPIRPGPGSSRLPGPPRTVRPPKIGCAASALRGHARRQRSKTGPADAGAPSHLLPRECSRKSSAGCNSAGPRASTRRPARPSATTYPQEPAARHHQQPRRSTLADSTPAATSRRAFLHPPNSAHDRHTMVRLIRAFFASFSARQVFHAPPI